MPGRLTPLVTGEIYHVFNRGINRQPTFTNIKEYQRMLRTVMFYKFMRPPIKLSKFLKLEAERQEEILKILHNRDVLNDIFAYCLMPNHFHLLLKQKKDNGIAVFLSNMQNSYTRYFNTRNERDGSLFLDQFKAIRIETDDQLLHVSRYIHLNPYTGFIIKSLRQLDNYPWSSFSDYLRSDNSFVDTEFLLNSFKNRDGYKKFVYNQADYQRKLKLIAHLVLE